ncbi:1,4-alpha-glucan branching protein GlgB [Paraliomyxa miuraensis]|uniref:1,4-alpha-glucan branching protein GlgB n=1 Tax=Paraliomyxa miuraensis TaxID=376150 RepID=UPI00225C24E2|nr:1,4-alpha-glucan branching protein GlgB [Paraliomyxa miuraensis]MCX4241089.1 1,4-alpha-glucan branching protein GlgB [Paraliomyxa miuraensis]
MTNGTGMDGTGTITRTDERLFQLAREHGLEESYVDITGQRRDASPEGIRAVLTALGVAVERDEDVERELSQARTARWSRPLEPVIVAWEGEGAFSLHLPASVDRGRYSMTLTAEDGSPPRSAQGRLEDHPVAASDELEGRRFVARQLSLSSLFPGPLPHGYHHLSLEIEGAKDIRGQAVVMSAPLRAYAPDGFEHARHFGVFLPLYALHGERSLGAGDLGDLGALMRWVGEQGGSVVGTLPLLAAFLDEPYEWSPYAPASRLAWNELYLHLEALPEYQHSTEARALYDGPQAQAERERLGRAPLVDYRGQMAFKRRAIAAMAEACAAGPRFAQLQAFAKERPEIDGYARFRAVVDRQRVVWPQWPTALRDGTITDRDYGPADHRTHLYAQWAMHQQLTALREQATQPVTQQANGGAGLGLYLDLPVGVNGCGYDTWRYGDLYVRGLSTGAPPDTLFDGGQNWAFPPLHPERLRQQGYRHFIDVIRNHLRYAGVLRVDHVMGLHRLYVIAQGVSAKEGIYLRYRPQEFYAILAIESHRARCLVVGEDLGTVPDVVREAMERHRVHKIHVVQYVARADGEQALPKAPANAVAGINTHDMPPFAAFWTGADIDDRVDLGWIDPEQAAAEHVQRGRLRANLRRFLSRESTLAPDADAPAALEACLSHLGRSPSPLVLASLEDLWGELHPQNVPGTYLERPNWQRRAKLSLPQMKADPEVTRLLASVQRARSGQQGRVGPVRHDVTRLTADDVYLFNEGTHERIYERLGAHPMEVDGQDGTYFAVWAPGAHYVAVVGDFNAWDRGAHPLRKHDESGVWEGFVPGAREGSLYKLHVAGQDGSAEDKSDPLAFWAETSPRTASVVTHSRHAWNDADWMASRAKRQHLHEPLSIYEVHLGSWRRVPEEGDRFLGYRELAPLLADYCREQGFTHVEFMPVMEHPFYGSWGYQVTGYFAPTSRYGTPDDLRFLVDHLHQAGIGVILDWVPSHFPSDAHGLARFDGTHLYEHADPRQGFHPDWNSAIFNYGRHEVRSFLISSALYWLDQFHIDGLRVDAVASMLYLDYSRAAGEWVPNVYGGRENLDAIAFLRRLNDAVDASFPGVQMIAEESTAWPLVSRPTHLGGLGFELKWDMGWMHDTLRYLARDPIHRGWHQNELTFRIIYAFNESFVLSLSHDEVVHAKGSMLGKMPGDRWQKHANLRLLYGYMWGQPGKKLLFMGQEFGQLAEWNHDRSLDWHLLHDDLHGGLKRWVGDLNRLYRELPSLHHWDHDPRGFAWIDFHDATFSVFSFMRRDPWGGVTVIVLNFTPVPRHDYRVGVPRGGSWAERLNSDATCYGGSGVGNDGGVWAEEHGAHEQPYSVRLHLPPLGVLFLHQPGAQTEEHRGG